MGLWLQIQNYYHANRITHQDRLRELFIIALQSVSKYPSQVNGKTPSWKILERPITCWTTRGQGAMSVYEIKEITYHCSKVSFCDRVRLFANMKGTAKSDQSLVGGSIKKWGCVRQMNYEMGQPAS